EDIPKLPQIGNLLVGQVQILDAIVERRPIEVAQAFSGVLAWQLVVGQDGLDVCGGQIMNGAIGEKILDFAKGILFRLAAEQSPDQAGLLQVDVAESVPDVCLID